MRRLALLVLGISACGDPSSPGTRVRVRELDGVLRAGYARTSPAASLEEHQARAEALRARLWESSRLDPLAPAPAATAPLAPRTVGQVVIHDLLIDGFEGMKIPATLLMPLGAAGPVPAVLVNVGHDPAGKNAPYARQICWTLALRGIGCMTIDWLGMGSRFAPEHRHVPLGLRSFLAGLLPTEPLLGEPLAAWRYLAARPDVDPARVAMAGQSGGGMVTMHLAAMEPRIAAAVIVDIVASNHYQFETLPGWGDPDSFLPGFHAAGSHGDLLAMIAPRPLLVLSSDEDAIAPTAQAEPERAIAARAYQLLGAPAGFEHAGYADLQPPHCWCGPKILATVDFLSRALTGESASSTATPPAGTEGRATEPDSAPHWIELLVPRLVAPPADPGEVQARLRELLAVETLPPADFPEAPDDLTVGILWLSDAGAAPPALEGAWVLEVEAGWLELAGEGDDTRRYAAQKAIQLGQSLLGYAAEDLLWVAGGMRAAGAARVLALCDGPQAALACLAAAAEPGGLDGLAVTGLVADFHDVVALGADPFTDLPYGMLVTPDLGAVASPDLLLAQIAPRPLAVVGAPAGAFPVTRAQLGPLPFADVDLAAAAARLVAAP